MSRPPRKRVCGTRAGGGTLDRMRGTLENKVRAAVAGGRGRAWAPAPSWPTTSGRAPTPRPAFAEPVRNATDRHRPGRRPEGLRDAAGHGVGRRHRHRGQPRLLRPHRHLGGQGTRRPAGVRRTGPRRHVGDRAGHRAAGRRGVGVLLQAPPQHARHADRRGHRRRGRARTPQLRPAAGGAAAPSAGPTSGSSCAGPGPDAARTARRPRCGPTTAPTPAPPSVGAAARAPRSRSSTGCPRAPARCRPHLHGDHHASRVRRPADVVPHPARREPHLRLPADRRRASPSRGRSSGTTTTGWTAPRATTGAGCRACSS